MAVRPLGKDELAAIARGYGMHLSDQDLGSFGPMVAGLLSSPVGMMIVGKRFDDATCLRVAHAFEQLTGGFPAPPAAA
jgi:hypothetical protein